MSASICLIVDDEPAIRTYLSAIVRHRGMESVEAGNAVEALRSLQRLGGQIDLLITDIQMPGDMDGIDLASSVKSSFSTIRVILISGWTDRVPTGFTFVQKPFMPDAILKAIDTAMHRSGARGAETNGAGS